MSYTFNNNSNTFGLITEGEYETTLERIVEGETPNGKKKLDLMFVIEDSGTFNKRKMFDTIWKERDTEFYNRRRLNMLLGTQHFEDGKEFANIQEIIEELTNTKVRIKIVKAFDDYRKEDVNKIAYYMTSTNQPKTLIEKIQKQVEISDDDLPF
jgi:hypothetical protein